MSEQPLQAFGIRSQPVNFRALPPLSLYIHIPWCVRKCPYCDFNSHEAKPVLSLSKDGGLPEREYVAALVRDLEMALPLIWGRKVYTVFFGGGTPSLLSGESVTEILRQVRMLLPLDINAEITLEANPGTVEADKFAAFREAGVNRLSLGIQSFNDTHLQALGRIHSAADARRAIRIAQQHFDNINLDLMYALPNQAQEQALQDVQAALQFRPQHLSCYHLTLEPNTLFAHQPPPLPDEDVSSDMQQSIEALLAAHGYEHYETSAFAQPGRRSRHNLNYWQFGDYLGIGAGAHSKLSFHDKILRQARYKQPQAYMEAVAHGQPVRARHGEAEPSGAGVPALHPLPQSAGCASNVSGVQEEHEVSHDDIAFEFMMNALRLNGGFDSPLFTERTSLPLLSIRRELAEAEERGLLFQDHKKIAPTESGRRFLNDLLQIFLREGS
ncbi:oxygen-independent coproporphyrinogen-III oxidase-like protein [mine drainage metagenome]|uniref:Oxygen-independent coproporphyrinogen-III oxidase-like protein n=1 Tax=mine drainage metagenome TaxID=410659 RepID=A0A1J5RJ89_9ZZZZ